jgi:hypothetical protein
MVLQQDSHRPSAAQPDPPLTLMDSETNVQAESEVLYKYLTQFHLALGFVMTKYAPDPQVTFDHRLSHPACLGGPCTYSLPFAPNDPKLHGRRGMQRLSAAKHSPSWDVGCNTKLGATCIPDILCVLLRNSFARVELNTTRVRLLVEDIDVHFVLEVSLHFVLFTHRRFSMAAHPHRCPTFSPHLQVCGLSLPIPPSFKYVYSQDRPTVSASTYVYLINIRIIHW